MQKVKIQLIYYICFITWITIGHISAFSLPWGPYVISRAGRGSPSEHWYDYCCPLGLKWEIASNGQETPLEYEYCSGECCDLLEEVNYKRTDGTEYTYCKHRDPNLNSVLKKEIKHLSIDEINKLAQLFESGYNHR